jgi:hypothetical protein
LIASVVFFIAGAAGYLMFGNKVSDEVRPRVMADPLAFEIYHWVADGRATVCGWAVGFFFWRLSDNQGLDVTKVWIFKDPESDRYVDDRESSVVVVVGRRSSGPRRYC